MYPPFDILLMRRITKQQLADNLSAAIHKNVGLQGLNTLIYGWLRYKRYGHDYYEAVRHRNWLYLTEAAELSEYVGYDLTQLPATLSTT